MTSKHHTVLLEASPSNVEITTKEKKELVNEKMMNAIKPKRENTLPHGSKASRVFRTPSFFTKESSNSDDEISPESKRSGAEMMNNIKPKRENALPHGSNASCVDKPRKRVRTPSVTSNPCNESKNDPEHKIIQNPAQKDARLIMQPMLSTTLLQCKSCSEQSRNRYVPSTLENGKLLLHLVMCTTCQTANKKVRYINNFTILPLSKVNYVPSKKLMLEKD